VHRKVFVSRTYSSLDHRVTNPSVGTALNNAQLTKPYISTTTLTHRPIRLCRFAAVANYTVLCKHYRLGRRYTGNVYCCLFKAFIASPAPNLGVTSSQERRTRKPSPQGLTGECPRDGIYGTDGGDVDRKRRRFSAGERATDRRRHARRHSRGNVTVTATSRFLTLTYKICQVVKFCAVPGKIRAFSILSHNEIQTGNL